MSTIWRPRDRDHAHPHQEWRHARQRHPSRAAQQPDAHGKQHTHNGNGAGGARGGDPPREPRALALNELDDRHAAGRLVTA
ncbi:MAG TPA: hypothetical protein VFG84_05535 [Gemmatimonadaceae bacterium]|nr:hypothetical protein [Gemmatimonadaceae bacterium]